MKRILLLLLLLLLFTIPLFSLSGCSFFITVTTPRTDRSIVDGTKLWFKKGTREQVSPSTYRNCSMQGRRKDSTLRNLPLNSAHLNYYKIAWYQGKCLHNLGYVFKENIFSNYCYHEHNEVRCAVFRKFKH